MEAKDTKFRCLGCGQLVTPTQNHPIECCESFRAGKKEVVDIVLDWETLDAWKFNEKYESNDTETLLQVIERYLKLSKPSSKNGYKGGQMNWRPERWYSMVESPYMHDGVKMAKENPDKALELEWKHQAFRKGQEAGADAMLETLRARQFLDMGKLDKLNIPGIYERPIEFVADCDGKLVLIPNDKTGE